MKRITLILVAAMTLGAAACTTAPAPPPVVAPSGEMRYLVDPRTGAAAAAPAVDQKFDEAWRFLLAGDDAQARRRLADLRMKNPAYAPAALAEAAMLIRAGNAAEARAIVDRVLQEQPAYLAARIYSAELSLAAGDVRSAESAYRQIARDPQAPQVARDRAEELSSRLYEQLMEQARSTDGLAAIPVLREVLALRPGAVEPRIQLAQRLAAGKQYEEARRELDPLLNSTEVDRPEVQELLADVDVSRGRYQEAIVRLDRLARRTKDARFTRRLDEVKELWNAANMPPQYQAALSSESLTRADFAVLTFWKVQSIRFAQNLGAPPIAIDVADVAGREEMIRAIAIGLYEVDAVTRRVSPLRPVSVSSLARLSARLLAVRGAQCARGINGSEGGELGRAQRILAACGVTDPTAGLEPDTPATGRAAAAMLEQIDKVLSR